jgi:acetoin:2,6-dichlorophenolindophenol oxidoreductase subunit beta
MSTHPELQVHPGEQDVAELTYRDAVCLALEHALAEDPTVVFMGEDVGGAGGVYKTSQGLLEKFGRERVRDTPICENGFVGVAIGMAATGMRPVVEIMFSDFLPTAGDAVVNELPKFRFMSGGQCTVPVTVRAVGGATGRFGTQHSATGESWFIGLPGLKVATVASPAAAYGLLRAAIRDEDPVLLFEHKALFGRRGPVPVGDDAILPVGSAAVLREGSDITVLGTMLMVDRAVAAAEVLAGEGVEVELIDLRWLRPLDYDTIIASVTKTGRLLVVEEQVHAGGWGATVISELTMRGVSMSRPSALSLADDVLIPYSPSLEDEVVPSVERIAESVRAALASR